MPRGILVAGAVFASAAAAAVPAGGPTPVTVPAQSAEAGLAPVKAVPFGADSVRAVVEKHQPEITACYEQRLSEGKNVQGEVLVSFVIGRDGIPVKAKVKKSTLGDPDIEACVLRTARGWIFPKPPVPQSVVLPLHFDEIGRSAKGL